MQPLDTKQYIEQQRQDWNRVAPAWEKWDRQLDQNLSFVNFRLVGDARLRAGQRVLDLGCGTGYPAILAAQVVGGQGLVVGLDLSEGMLSVARRKAEGLGLRNITFHIEDATTLPFELASFDAVISRFCLMFLPDIPKALNEIARVLRPDGYLAAAIWSTPDKNPFIRIPVDVIKRFIEVPTPAPDQPGIFRLARQGDLLRITEEAGLTGISDEEVTGESIFDSADEYLENVRDLAAPLHPLFARLSSAQRIEAETEIKGAVNQYLKGEQIALPMTFRIVVARKP